jgi:parvulin-like peptidyl-prolyl isomerase
MHMKRLLRESLLVSFVMISIGMQGACGKEPPQQSGGGQDGDSAAASPGAKEPLTDDVIASVGDQKITFSEINTMLNSSAVVGVSLPALGTPERDTVRIALLDKVVSANLIYLDALKQGQDKGPAYQREIAQFSDGILTGLYRNKVLLKEVEISDAEVEAYFKESVAPGTELTDDVRTALKSTMRKQRLNETGDQLRATLREGVTVEINDAELDPLKDAERADTAVMATIDGKPLAWGEVKERLGAKVSSTSSDQRRAAVNSLVDERIMVDKAKAIGLEQDPAYQARVKEYRKTRLINLHRAALVKTMEPSDEELHAYFEANRARITIPEYRKVQMVVLKTEDEAKDIKDKIAAGEITMYQAAADYSVAPGARENLGEIGWVEKGKALPGLNDVVFALGPGEVGGPVQVGDVWHLVMVQDVREPQYTDFEDEKTRKMTRRRYLHEKLDEYTVKLREQEFPVKVYEDKLIRLAQQEADMVKQLAEKAQQPGSETEKRIGEFQKLMKQ